MKTNNGRRMIAVELEAEELARMREVSARCRAPSVELATAAIRVVLEMPEGTVRAIVAQYGRRARQPSA
jgi:hypothetical protein